MSALLNCFFASVFTHENVGSFPEVNQVFIGDSSQSLSEVKITSSDVLNKVIKLKDGDDGIMPEFLQEIASEISEPLSIVYNKSIAEEVVPQE